MVEIVSGEAGQRESPFKRRIVELEVADDARETKGDYRRPDTKTSNSAIADAAYQVTLAHRATIKRAFDRSRARIAIEGHRIPKRQAFFPIIVTSARLRLCLFDPRTVSPTTGEIPYEKAQLEDKDIIIYEYPVPPHLAGLVLRPRPTYRFETKSFRSTLAYKSWSVHSEFFPKLLPRFGIVDDRR